MLSDGEHVTNARSAKQYGPLLDAINGDRIGRMSDGGWTNPPLITVPKVTANNNTQQEITLRVIGEEGPMFRPTIKAESQGVAVRVVQAGINQYDKQLDRSIGGKLANAQSRNI